MCGSVVQIWRSDAIGREDGQDGGRIASDMNVIEENLKTPLRVRGATEQRRQAIQTSKERQIGKTHSSRALLHLYCKYCTKGRKGTSG